MTKIKEKLGYIRAQETVIDMIMSRMYALQDIDRPEVDADQYYHDRYDSAKYEIDGLKKIAEQITK